jgi:hypothetical protein
MRMPPLAGDAFHSVRGADGPYRPRIVHKACGHCQRPISLLYRPAFALRPVAHLWRCPHDECQPQAMNRITLPGVLLDCWPGHGPKPLNEALAT